MWSLAGIDQSQPEQEVNEIEGQGENPEEAPGAQEVPQKSTPKNLKKLLARIVDMKRKACGSSGGVAETPHSSSPKAKAEGTQ